MFRSFRAKPKADLEVFEIARVGRSLYLLFNKRLRANLLVSLAMR